MAKYNKKTLLGFEIKERFNPEGNDYDYVTAKELGLLKERKMFYRDAPAKARHHLPSLDPRTGMILKGRSHPTFSKTLAREKELGNAIIKKDGRYFSIKERVSEEEANVAKTVLGETTKKKKQTNNFGY